MGERMVRLLVWDMQKRMELESEVSQVLREVWLDGES